MRQGCGETPTIPSPITGEEEASSRMTEQLDLFRQTWRDHDPVTSVMAAANVTCRARSQKWMLLVCYAQAGYGGLTDEEAGIRSGLKATGANYWRRCTDLRAMGLIEPTGKKRLSTMGEFRMVCRITESGRLIVEGAQE